nr:MAG TPA: hypothetical protein [Caudoviricetes sp.]
MERIIHDILLLLFYSFISYSMITVIVFLTAVVFHLHFSFGISFVIWLIMVFMSGVE